MNGLINKALNYFSLLVCLGKWDVLFTSFPKSGNTWVRFFLINLYQALHDADDRVDFKKLDRIMPEIGKNNLCMQWAFPNVPRVIKTHSRYRKVFGNVPAFQIVRDPRDVMVSSFHYYKSNEVIDADTTFKDFIRMEKYGLESWFSYHDSWSDHVGLYVKYEDLKRDETMYFKKILEFLGLEVEESVLLLAIEKASFKSVRKIEENEKPVEEGKTFFTRKGEIGEYREYFDDEDLELYRSMKERYGIDLYE